MPERRSGNFIAKGSGTLLSFTGLQKAKLALNPSHAKGGDGEVGSEGLFLEFCLAG
jgi:hypothetical protein